MKVAFVVVIIILSILKSVENENEVKEVNQKVTICF